MKMRFSYISVFTVLITVALAATFTSCKNNGQTNVAAVQTTTGGPKLTLDKEVHDYGTIKKGADGTCVFKVTNTGDQPLIISECKKTCGCTVPNCDSSPIAPGASSEIKVTYDTQRVGPINKSVTVISNSKDEEIKVIRIKGEVIDPDAPQMAGNNESIH